MAGIYIHIPFCKSRCVYCDFFSSTHLAEKELYVEALCRELDERKNYLQGQPIETVYFGGGTPSQLSFENFLKIFKTLGAGYTVHGTRAALNRAPCTVHRESLEITLEANPDDLTPEYFDALRYLPFNRISIGVQSFNDAELKFLNRRHDATAAIRAVRLCQEKGFENISIDLMYGLPNQTSESWKTTVRQAIALNVQHISAYHLIYEEGTPLFRLLEQKKIVPVEEDLSVQLFEILIDQLSAAGFEHYEISNFAKPGFQSRHNASYWNGTHYLGIGAAAHSYNGVSRQWNQRVQGAGYKVHEIEMIDAKTAYNDFIITRLRTMKGMDLNELQTLFGIDKRVYCLKQAKKFITAGLLEIYGNHLRLTRKGIFVSDGIMSELMM